MLQASHQGHCTAKHAGSPDELSLCGKSAAESMTFQDWWMAKGHEYFSQSITTLQVTLFVEQKHIDAFEITVDAFQDVSNQLAGKDDQFGAWVNRHYLIKRQHTPPKGDVFILGLRRT